MHPVAAMWVNNVPPTTPHAKHTSKNKAISKIEYVTNGKVDSVRYMKL